MSSIKRYYYFHDYKGCLRSTTTFPKANDFAHDGYYICFREMLCFQDLN